MGICGSNASGSDPNTNPAQVKQEKISDKQIDQKMRESDLEEGKINKLLLLGAGASGKSTLFKQMITIYGNIYIERYI